MLIESHLYNMAITLLVWAKRWYVPLYANVVSIHGYQLQTTSLECVLSAKVHTGIYLEDQTG